MPTPERDAKRVILITGCSSGIGRSTAEILLERGHTVYATARRTESIEDLTHAFQRFGDRARIRRLDVTEPPTGAEVVADVIDRDGRIDALVNNAAYGQMGVVEELTTEQLRRQFEVNVIGWLDLTRRVIPEMRHAGFGRLVNVSSVAAHVSAPLTGAYNASKTLAPPREPRTSVRADVREDQCRAQRAVRQPAHGTRRDRHRHDPRRARPHRHLIPRERRPGSRRIAASARVCAIFS